MDYIFHLDADENDLLVAGQVLAGPASQFQGRGQVDVVGRGTALGGHVAAVEPVECSGFGAGLDGIDHDGPIVAHHAFHQFQPTPIVLDHVHVGPLSELFLQPSGHAQPYAVVAHDRIAESNDQCFHE